MSKETQDPKEADLALLLTWLRWYARVAAGAGLFFLVLFVLRRSPASFIIGTSVS